MAKQWKADDGSLINYEVHGDDQYETLLLLPGLLGAISSQWRPFVEPLSKAYRIVLLDYRGHGLSENKASGLVPNQLMLDIIGLMDSLSIQQMHVAGYSLGGYLGLMLALNYPRRVQTLLMHATKFYWTKEAVEMARGQFDPDVMAQKVPSYANQLAEEHGGGRWRALVRQSSDLVGRMASENITERMAASVQIPVLVSVGDRDEMVSLPECHRLSRLFPSGGLSVLPHVRHPFASVGLVPLLPLMHNFHRTPTRR